MPQRGVIPRFSVEIEEALQQAMKEAEYQQQQQNNSSSSNPASPNKQSGKDETENNNNRKTSTTTIKNSELPPTGKEAAQSNNQQQQQQQTLITTSTNETSSNSNNNNTELLSDLSVFDAPNFRAVDFVNKRFPDEASLDGLGGYIEEVRRRLSDTESSLLDAVRVQACTAATASQDLDQAKKAVLSLRSRVENIKRKADTSEETVVNICSSIKQLDVAKRNLTNSIVTINQLQLFLRAVQGLGRAIEMRNYAQINDLLRQALRYNERFEPYFDIPKVKELHVKLSALKRRVSQCVVTDILHELCPSLRRYSQGASQHKLGSEGLVHACLVVDALGKEVMEEVRSEFIGSQLEEYTAYLFKRGSKEAALEKTERRFVWFRQLLEKHETLFLTVFPLHWFVMQELCISFCKKTAEELEYQLRFESGSVEVAVLIYMLQRTMEAEKDLTSRMKWYEMELREKLRSDWKIYNNNNNSTVHGGDNNNNNAGDNNNNNNAIESSTSNNNNKPPLSQNAVPEYKVFGFMTSCFDDYLEKYVQHEDDSMTETIAQQLATDSINEELLVFESTQDIFLYIQESMRRAATITSDRSQSTLTELCGVWHKHMNEYAQTLQKMATNVPTTKEQEKQMCVLVNSADYCRSAAEGLGEDLYKLLADRNAIADSQNDVVNNFSQVCTFASTQLAEAVCSNLGSLISEYQTFLASGATSTSSAHGGNSGSGAMMEAIDESFFPGAVRRVLNEHFTNFATYLLPNLYSFVITKAATSWIPRLNRVLYRPNRGGRLTEAVISQMRVDMVPLEKIFTAAPQIAINAAKDANQNPFSSRLNSGSSNNRNRGTGGGSSGDEQFSSPAYSKTVRREFGRIIAALRVLQLPPGERFIEGYYQIVDKEDRSIIDCARLLELLGVGREDQRQWLALLRRRGDVPDQTRRDGVIALMGGSSATAATTTTTTTSTTRTNTSSSSSAPVAGGGGNIHQGSVSGGLPEVQQHHQQQQRTSMGSRLVQLFGGDDNNNENHQNTSSSSQRGGGGNATNGGDKEESAWDRIRNAIR